MEHPFTPVLSLIIALTVLWPMTSTTPVLAITMLKSEEKAVVQSGWWPQYTNTSFPPCQYPGITCNHFGSVTAISLPSSQKISEKLRKMNFSLIPNLLTLQIQKNGITGTIPSQLCVLTKLRTLTLTENYLSGNIPSCLGNLSKLVTLELSNNNLNGSIPSQLGSPKNLSYLYLDGNELTGSIPSTVGQLSHLIELRLSSNHLSGFIPASIGNLTSMLGIKLDGNFFKGPLPSTFGHLWILCVMNLNDNNFVGPIPSSIGNMSNLKYMNLQENQIDGSIPPQVGNMTLLYDLNISFNRIVGRIPPEIGRLEQLQFLDLRNNSLSGSIPDSLNISVLSSLNLSYNSLSGQIPDSILNKFPKSAFYGNKDIVYNIVNVTNSSPPQATQPHQTSHKISRFVEIILPVVLFFFFLIVLLSIWLHCQKRVKPSIPNEKIAQNGDVFSIWNYDGRIAYEDIVNATEDFDLKYCIGTGGYGSVYKAELPNGKVIAVKKLHRLEAEEPAFDKSFKNEVKLLTEIRHRNIIKLHGFCLHKRCMFLVYEYMERGSLFYALRNDAEALELSWTKRLDIVKGIAHAMSYLHHHCSPPIIHRDLSTNNILLNNEMQAFVSDFGTARLHDPASTNISAIAGTSGYVAPELAYMIIFNEKCDVYSYGVVAMETIMGKHPEETISKLLTSSIEHVKLQEIIDPRLPCPSNDSLVALGILQAVSYALACLSPIPNSRPSMKHISEAFLSTKRVAFDGPFHEITLGQLQSNHEATT